MSTKAPPKGRALEKAVKLIQESILQSDPKLKGAAFTIEANKIVSVSGVRHELDIFVKTLPDSPYEATWIFECKDWKKPVGKNEVIILARKVDAIHANRGFLVARALTKDAKAQLNLDPRLTFIKCTDQVAPPWDQLQLLHTTHELLPVRVFSKQRGVPAPPAPAELKWKESVFRLDGAAIDFPSFVQKHVEELLDQDRSENPLKYRYEGTHPGAKAVSIVFAPGEFTLDGNDIAEMEIHVRFMVTVARQKLTSKFELEGQGSAFSFEPIRDLAPGKALQIHLVRRPHPGTTS